MPSESELMQSSRDGNSSHLGKKPSAGNAILGYVTVRNWISASCLLRERRNIKVALAEDYGAGTALCHCCLWHWWHWCVRDCRDRALWKIPATHTLLLAI